MCFIIIVVVGVNPPSSLNKTCFRNTSIVCSNCFISLLASLFSVDLVFAIIFYLFFLFCCSLSRKTFSKNNNKYYDDRRSSNMWNYSRFGEMNLEINRRLHHSHHFLSFGKHFDSLMQ